MNETHSYEAIKLLIAERLKKILKYRCMYDEM